MKPLLSAILLVASISPAFAQDAGVSDAPLAVRMENGHLDLSPAAESRINDEMVRLQGVERLHKAEKWLPVVMVSTGVGVAVGVAVTVAVMLLGAPKERPAPAAAPPSP